MAPLPASAFSNSLPGPVSLPLYKLSYCTMRSPGAQMLWAHLHNNNLFAVFDNIRSRGPNGTVLVKEVLKLIHGGELFEMIEFDSLKNDVRMDEQRAQSQGMPDHLRSVIVLIKKPLLALRYTLPDGQIRKIQMNFRPDTGFDTAVEMLVPLGLPIRDQHKPIQAQPPVQRPNSSSQALLPSSVNGSQEFKGACNIPDDRLPYNARSVYDQARPSSSTVDSRMLVPPVVQLTRTSAFSTDSNNPDDFSKPISYVHDPRSQPQRPRSSSNTSYYSNSLHRPSSLSTAFGSTDQNRIMPPHSRTLLPSPIFHGHSSPLNGYGYRPISAPETQSDRFLPDTVPISHMLPPVRELPFPRDAPSIVTEVAPESSAEQSTSVQIESKARPKRKRAPAKPKASLSNKGPKSRPTKATKATGRSSGAPPSSAPVEKPTSAEESLNVASASSAPPQTRSTKTGLEATVPIISEDVTPPSSRGDGGLLKKRPLSPNAGTECNKRQQRTLNQQPSPGTPQTGDQNPANLSNVNPAELLDSLGGWIRKYHDLPAPKPPTTGKDQLAAYASKSAEERSKIIDTMICDCLQDENFGKLADDLEGHWKRITLGF